MSAIPGVRKIPWKKDMATHSSILAWEIPWTEEPNGPQSMALQSLSDLATEPPHSQPVFWWGAEWGGQLIKHSITWQEALIGPHLTEHGLYNPGLFVGHPWAIRGSQFTTHSMTLECLVRTLEWVAISFSNAGK